MLSRQDIEEAVGLDKLVYDKQYSGTVERCLEWAKVNPDIYIMIKENDHVVAYANIMPVTGECYMQLRSGSFLDMDITPDMILPYQKNQIHNIYISSVVVHPDHRNIHVIRTLLRKIKNKFKQLENDNIYVTRILVDAISPAGIKLCWLFKMRIVGITQHHSVIYETTPF